MKVKSTYNVALLDGDLLIITPPTYDLPENTSYSTAAKENTTNSSNTLVQSILDRMYRRESELPYLFLQWPD